MVNGLWDATEKQCWTAEPAFSVVVVCLHGLWNTTKKRPQAVEPTFSVVSRGVADPSGRADGSDTGDRRLRHSEMRNSGNVTS
jgi:hypothetical protein